LPPGAITKSLLFEPVVLIVGLVVLPELKYMELLPTVNEWLEEPAPVQPDITRLVPSKLVVPNPLDPLLDKEFEFIVHPPIVPEIEVISPSKLASPFAALSEKVVFEPSVALIPSSSIVILPIVID